MPVDGAVIAAVRTTGGHDGDAALVLDIRYPGGAIGEITLDGATGVALMAFCGVDDADGLVGESWHMLQRAVLQRDELEGFTGD
jgi:hypothetical protein